MPNELKKNSDRGRKNRIRSDKTTGLDSVTKPTSTDHERATGPGLFALPWFQALLVGIGVFILLITSTIWLPVCWDEGDALHRVRLINSWFALVSGEKEADVLPAGSGLPWSRPFSKQTIDAYWLHTTQVEGHPAGYTLLSAAGYGLCRLLPFPITTEIVKYRLGCIALFAFALGACFYRMRVTFGFAAACFSVLCILCLPRVFAHAQLTVCDSMLMSGWILTWAFFEPGLTGRRGAILWGIMLGLGLSAKFAGLVIVSPFVVFAVLCLALKVKIPGMMRLMLLGIPACVVMFCILNPNVWYNPIAGLIRFFSLYLSEKTEHFVAQILFFNGYYSIKHPLPWYNTLVWMGITVPVGILLVFLWFIGKECVFGVQWLRNRKTETEAPLGMTSHRRVVLLVLCFSALMVLRSLPGTPVHDGVRQIVSCFPFLGILAGIAMASLWKIGTSPDAAMESDSNTKKEKSKVGSSTVVVRVLLTSVLASSFFNLYWYAPNWLSYYNAAIGGVKGATAAGMETTFYWDGMSMDVFDWLNEHTDYEGSVSGVPQYVVFMRASNDLTYLYRTWGFIGPCRVATEEYRPEGVPRWCVFQFRQGAGTPQDYPFLRGKQPVFLHYIRQGGFGPWDLGQTPLIEIYDSQGVSQYDNLDWSREKKNKGPIETD